jgi:NTE family protein
LKRRPTIGLALGSGSARGLSHIGAIRAIREAGIPIDVVAGTSIGALIGAGYASGRLDVLEEAFRSLDRKAIAALVDPVLPRSGLIEGKRIVEFIRRTVGVRTFDELSIPFCAIAADIRTGDEVPISDGDLVTAIRASISIPGVFTPVRHQSRILVDGGLVNPVPVSAARALGADVVLAIDLNHGIVAAKAGRAGSKRPGGKRRSGRPVPGMVEVLLASLYISQVRVTESRLRLDPPDLLLRPPLSAVHLFEFDRAEELMNIGYRSAQELVREFAGGMLL